MNFGWMVEQVDMQWAFWLLGVGSLVVGVALIWRLIMRGSPLWAERHERWPGRAEGHDGPPLC